jgi:hypothetical protein
LPAAVPDTVPGCHIHAHRSDPLQGSVGDAMRTWRHGTIIELSPTQASKRRGMPHIRTCMYWGGMQVGEFNTYSSDCFNGFISSVETLPFKKRKPWFHGLAPILSHHSHYHSLKTQNR